MYQTSISAFSNATSSIPINIIEQADFDQWLQEQSSAVQQWARVNAWHEKLNQALWMADENGNFMQVYYIGKEDEDWMRLGALTYQLPAGDYHFKTISPELLNKAYLAWGMSAYQFTRYKKATKIPARLAWVNEVDQAEIQNKLQAIYYARDWINTPAADMNPEHLATVASAIAQSFNAHCEILVGEDLLKQNYPCVYHVGRGSAVAPRLIKMSWGDASHPKIALIGKGVCFDTGGLDIKPASGMALMKKDMGGAAIALALAYLIMAQKLPIQFELWIPAVENSISGNAYLPGDVLTSRSGKTIEITNTDAEGRLILCDAITAAAESSPALMIDFATLTGAARVALGMEINAFFATRKNFANALPIMGLEEKDFCWELPLFEAYVSHLESPIADLANASSSGYAGAISAALFLKQFVPNTIPWVHFDLPCWNVKTRAGHPEGGEAMSLRAVYSLLEKFCQEERSCLLS